MPGPSRRPRAKSRVMLRSREAGPRQAHSQGNRDPTWSNCPEQACQCPVGGNRSWEKRGAEARKWRCPQLLLLPALPPLRLDRGAQPLPGSRGVGSILGVGPIAWLPSGPSLCGVTFQPATGLLLPGARCPHLPCTAQRPRIRDGWWEPPSRGPVVEKRPTSNQGRC